MEDMCQLHQGALMGMIPALSQTLREHAPPEHEPFMLRGVADAAALAPLRQMVTEIVAFVLFG
jgi:hypothetical protein